MVAGRSLLVPDSSLTKHKPIFDQALIPSTSTALSLLLLLHCHPAAAAPITSLSNLSSSTVFFSPPHRPSSPSPHFFITSPSPITSPPLPSPPRPLPSSSP
ncbi:hypothetical protein Droror1_Dr00019939 [Drosera rotundifolia]